MKGEKDFGTHKTTLIAIIYNMNSYPSMGNQILLARPPFFNPVFQNEKIPHDPFGSVMMLTISFKMTRSAI